MSWVIFKHYLKRVFTEPVGMTIYTVLPLALIVLNNVTARANAEYYPMFGGNSINASGTMLVIVPMFLFMMAEYTADYMHDDFIGAMRWRLLSAPASFMRYITAATSASVIFSMTIGILLIAVSAIAFDAYLFNPLVFLSVIFLICLMSQFFGILLLQIFRKAGTVRGIAIATAFLMSMFSGNFVGIGWIHNFFSENIAHYLIHYGTPFQLAITAIMGSGNWPQDILPGMMVVDMGTVLICLAALVGVTIVMAALVVIVGRRRPF